MVGSSVHFPVYVNSYGLFYNVPGNRVTPLNITACLAARILTGVSSGLQAWWLLCWALPRLLNLVTQLHYCDLDSRVALFPHL